MCNAGTASDGSCNGTLSGGEDLTGYTWADVDDVNGLFNNFSLVQLGPGPDDSNYFGQLAGATDFFEAGFTPWLACGSYGVSVEDCGEGHFLNSLLYGFTRQAPGTIGSIGWVGDLTNPAISDRFSTNQLWAVDSQPQVTGFWLFREAQTNVPAPATLALFGLGLVGLGWSRRKRA